MDQPAILPDDFDVMPPGPELAAVVASVDRSTLDGDDLLRVARARLRLVAHQEAQLLADLHRVARVVPDGGWQVGRRDPGKYPWADPVERRSARLPTLGASARCLPTSAADPPGC